MNHDETMTRLPWYLAGTLESVETAEVEAHLQVCTECQADLERCRLVARVHAAEHPAVEELVAATWGHLAEARWLSLATHLEECSECREEMALLSASRASEDSIAPVPLVLTPPPPSSEPITLSGRRWLVAATIVLVAATAALFATFRHLDTQAESLRAELQSLRDRTESAAEATAGAEQRIASLRGELVELRAPRAGIPVVEVLPERVLRGDPAGDPSVSVDVGSAPYVLLLLALEDPQRAPTYTVRWLDAERVEQFVSAAAAPDSTGTLALLVPTSSLPAGSVTLEVSAVGGEASGFVGHYRLALIGSGGAQPKTTKGDQ